MIGKFNEIATLYNATDATTDDGEPVKNYTLFAKIYAAIEDTSSEEYNNQTFINIPKLKLTTHHNAGINTSQRLVYNSVNYDITNIKKTGRKFIEIQAVKEKI